MAAYELSSSKVKPADWSEQDQVPLDGQSGGQLNAIYVGLVVLLGALAFFVVRQRRRRSHVESPATEMSSPMLCYPAYWAGVPAGVRWVLHPLPEGPVLDSIRQLVSVRHSEALGQGRDVQYQWPNGSIDRSIRVHCAWRLEHPGLWNSYLSARDRISHELQDTSTIQPFNVNMLPGLAGPAGQMPGTLCTDAGEVFLLHGTSPRNLLMILKGGLNSQIAKMSSAFGAGIYLAENVEKVDQYVTPDNGVLERSDIAELHSHLFSPEGIQHPGIGREMFYCLIVRAACGAQICTTGLHDRDPSRRHQDKRTGRSIFVDNSVRELVTIPDGGGIRYHSLRVDLGAAVKRFREFVILRDQRVYVEYIVGYTRLCTLPAPTTTS